MTKVVWKYNIKNADEFTVNMPADAEILSVQVQHGKPQLWAFVDPEAKVLHPRRFRLSGTGHPMTEGHYRFIGTFQLEGGNFVGHLFEVL